MSNYFHKFYDCFSDAGYLTFRVAVRRLFGFLEDPLRGLSLNCTDIHLWYMYLFLGRYGWASVIVHFLLTSISQELLGQSSLNSPNLVCSICRLKKNKKNFKVKIMTPPPHTHIHTQTHSLPWKCSNLRMCGMYTCAKLWYF